MARGWIGVALSFALILLVTLAGARTLPLLNAEETTIHLEAALPKGEPAEALPVFAVGGAVQAEQVGRAKVYPDSRVTVSLYRDVEAGAIQSLPPVLLKVDLRLLWAIASEENRIQLRANLKGLGDRLMATLEAVAASPEFEEIYRPALQAILQDAAEQALDDPRVKEALESVIDVLGDRFDDDFLSDYAGIIAKQSAAALIELSKLVPGLMTDLLTGKSIDWAILKDEVARLLDSREGRALVVARLREVLTSEASATLAGAFGRSVLARMAEDQRLAASLNAIAAEAAFDGHFRELEAASLDALKDSARILAGVEGSQRLHPLAAAVLRGLLFDQGDWIVVFVTPERLRLLRDGSGSGVYPLFAAES